MKRTLSTTWSARAAVCLLVLGGITLAGCTGGTSKAPPPPTAEEQQKLDEEMRKMQKKGGK
jgi:hypothetical protein